MPSHDPDALGALLEQAAALPPDERAAYVDKASNGDDDLRETLTSLVLAHDAAAEYFERITEQIIGPALAAFAADNAAEASHGRLENTVRPDLGRRLAPHEIGPFIDHGGATAQLLRRRLLTLAVVFVAIAGLGTTLFLWSQVLPALRDGMPVRPAVWIGLTLYALLLTGTVVFALVLRSPRPLSLQTLRTLEVVGFSSVTACEIWRIVVTWRAGVVFRYVTADTLGMMLLSARQCLTWFTLIVAYGVFIPNTWRRCALVVGLLAATPIVTAAICNAVFGGLDGKLLSTYLFNIAMWMMYAGALAIYGSHRIDVHRNEALEARELGQYRLKRLLGAGGMGEVYLAEHLLLRRQCAIKLIRTDRAGKPEDLFRFEREVHATAALTHPNTVHVYDYGHTDDGTFYYVMEYLPGLTLEELVREQGPLPASRVIYLLRQICGALSEAHAAGLIHRDVKPGNIMVCERGGVHDVAKLLDFGIVQWRAIADEETPATARVAIAGTPSFMSPEQITGAEVDERSDIYSLGSVGYFLLTGMPPFLRASAAETAAAHLRASVIAPDQIRSDVPADLQSVILRCLKKTPNLRYHSTAALEAALALCKHEADGSNVNADDSGAFGLHG